jgi:hypothetical protein
MVDSSAGKPELAKPADKPVEKPTDTTDKTAADDAAIPQAGTPDDALREAKTRAAFDASAHPTPDSELTEEKRRAAVDPYNDKQIAALLRERAGLVQAGKDDRVKQVDEQLKHYGYTGDGAAESAEPGKDEKASDDKAQQARKQAPQGRSTKPQQTTD